MSALGREYGGRRRRKSEERGSGNYIHTVFMYEILQKNVKIIMMKK